MTVILLQYRGAALNFAAMNGLTDVVKRLIEKNVDLEVKDNVWICFFFCENGLLLLLQQHRWTALQCAHITRKNDILLLLINKKASLKSKQVMTKHVVHAVYMQF